MKRKSRWVSLVLAVIFLSSCATAPRESTPAPVAPQATPREAETLWQQAEKEKKMGNIPSAIATWERIAQAYPGNMIAARALYEVGHIYLEQGQAQRALQYYDYLIYQYPRWEGVNLAKLDQFRALWMTGKRKQVMKEATLLWDASAQQPDVQVGLSQLMSSVYGSEGDVETAFDWLAAGFAIARTPEEKKSLTQATLELLKDKDAPVLHRLLKRTPNEFMKVFIDFRLAQLDMEKTPSDAAKERLRALLSQNASHPLAPHIQAALRGTVAEAEIPLNLDRVGCIVPVNGPYAKYGDMVLRGLTMAKADWNEKHYDQPVTLIIKDAQADPDQAVKAFERLAKKDGVLAVVGPLGSQAAKAVAPVAEQLGVPALTLTQKDEESGESSYALHLLLDNRQMIHTLVKYCRERLGFSRFAVMYPDDRYGQKASKIFSDVVLELGGEMMASVSYKNQTTDFKEPIQKLMTIAKKNAPPSGVETTPFDALFLPDQVQTVSLIAPQLPYNNVVGVTLLGTNLWGEGPLVEAGGVYVEQAIFATPYFAASENPRIRAFRERYEAMYHTPPSYLEAQAYDSLMLLLRARSGMSPPNVDRYSLLQNILQTQGFEGVAGVYSFTPEGDLNRSYHLLQVDNGQLVPLTP